ncbi:MAG: hypothetical protein J3R72DRAFT_518531 [Linnemannia gamsii]|nr:MAG: hypothetical protein J3R72DRAFT_518531 [Linnemannia gamsii]
MTNGPCLSATRVLTLPELLTPIGSFLNPPDLLPCVQVCQLWNQAFIPLLWRVIDDSRYSWPNVLAEVVNSSRADQAQKEEQLREIFTKYGRHIQHLFADGFLTIVTAQASGSCINLRTLAIKGTKTYISQEAWGVQDLIRGCLGSDEVKERLSKAVLSPVFEGVIMPSFATNTERLCQRWIFTQRFWLLVLQSPQLEGLRLGGKVETMFLPLQDAFIGRTLASLPKLTRLDNHLCSQVLPFSMVFEQLPELQRHTNYHSYSILPLFDNTLLQIQTFRSSMILQLPHFLSLLSFLPNLEQLWIRGFRLPVGVTAQSMGNITNTTTSRLVGLHFTDEGMDLAREMEKTLAMVVLPRVPCLTTLSHRALYSSTVAALARHCPRLQSFQQINVGDSLHPRDNFHFEANVVGTLLRQCPNLTTLDAISHSIAADYLLAEPWACRDLQTFRCQITGMNRLTVKEEEIYDTWATKPSLEDKEEEEMVTVDPNNKDEAQHMVKVMEVQKEQLRCRVHHKRVYRHLAKMTQLRVLDLGNEFRYPYEISIRNIQETMIGGRLYAKCSPPIANTLELTLESGLSKLRSLKNLEVFGFEGVDHRIEAKELAWMAENWPRLRIMRGLHSPPSSVLVANDSKTRMLREYMEELRPFVKHEAVKEEHAMCHRYGEFGSAL